MRCPFRYRSPNRRYSFGVSGDFLDFIEEGEREAEAKYNAAYPTCWLRFLHWLGLPTRPSRDTRLILERIKTMDTKVQALKDAFESYAADYEQKIAEAKAQAQAALDKAIADDRAGRDTDLDALKAEIEAAHAKITPPPAPPFEPSNQ